VTTPDLTVVICTRNRMASLERVLLRLEALTPPAHGTWDVVVADNASTDGTRDVVEAAARRRPGRVTYLFEGRVGKAFALNAAVAAARGERLLFTDDDVTIDPGWLLAYQQAFDDTDCLGAAGRVRPAFAGPPPAWLVDDLPFPFRFDLGDRPAPLTRPGFGANMAYHRDAFRRYGWFRTDLGPSAATPGGLGEDSEFGLRLLTARERLRYVPGAVVHHPVLAEQTTRRFLWSWHLRYGRSMVRRAGTPSGPAWFGVPRYLVRELAVFAARWLVERRAGRVRTELAVCRTIGQIVEARRRAAISRAGGPSRSASGPARPAP
jgi:glycosyltransferase involved in cell wall biosynthesis